MASATSSGLPTASATTSAPRSRVSIITRSRSFSFVGSTTTPAPRRLAQPRRSSSGSDRISRLAPRRLASAIVSRPMIPPPITSTVASRGIGLESLPMPRDATVLVIGGGIMGLLTMALARRRGAKRLILSDPLEERRGCARRLGAGVVVDPTKEKLRERVMMLTRDRGADVVAEAVGKPELVAEAMTLVKPGGVLQLVGVSPKGSEIPLSLWDVHYREIKIVGAFGRGTAFRRALALMPTLRVGRLITARFPLERIGEAFAHATAGRGAKTVITPNAR